MAQPLHVDRHDDGVVLLRLDVPDRRNAMTDELTAAWTAALSRLAEDESMRCLVVTGEGPVFCAGGDLSWLADAGSLSTDRLRARMLPFYRAWLRVRDIEVPTIAVLNGAAVGAGLALALACDLRYAAPQAPLSMPFTSLGIHPGMASTWLLPEVAGLAVAREMLLTGRVVSGAEGSGWGWSTACSRPSPCSSRHSASRQRSRPALRSRPGSRRVLSPRAGTRASRPRWRGSRSRSP